VPAIIYAFRAIGEALRKQRIDDWWQPAKPEPEPSWQEAAEQVAAGDWMLDPFGGWVGGY
jgi:hypothetical protein